MSKKFFALKSGLLVGLLVALCCTLLHLPAVAAYVSSVNIFIIAFGITISLRLYRDKVLTAQKIKFGKALWFCVQVVFWISIVQLIYYALQLYFWQDPLVYETLDQATEIMLSTYSGLGIESISDQNMQSIVQASSFLSVFIGYMFMGFLFALFSSFFINFFENKNKK